MAFSMHSKRRTAMSEINVTPLVDVMLVLLIIFMVTAPMMQEGLSVELPEAKGSAIESDQNAEPIRIVVASQGDIKVDKTPVSQDKLAEAIQEARKRDPKRAVYLEGDKGVDFGHVAGVLGALMSAGIKDISIVTSPPKESGPAK
jgi:biopolymer transport protein TolR